MTSLYLLVLTQDRSIRSLRDLTPAHLPLLRNIRQASEKVAMDKYGIDKGELRFFVHYQPTYCECLCVAKQRPRLADTGLVISDHFHVHVVSLCPICPFHPDLARLIPFVRSFQVHVNYENFGGITVGQAHLLDDVIDNLELEEEAQGSTSGRASYYSRKTFTYALGTNHKLFEGLSNAQ